MRLVDWSGPLTLPPLDRMRGHPDAPQVPPWAPQPVASNPAQPSERGPVSPRPLPYRFTPACERLFTLHRGA